MCPVYFSDAVALAAPGLPRDCGPEGDPGRASAATGYFPVPLDSVEPLLPVEPAVPDVEPLLLCFFFVLLEEDLVLLDSVEPEPPVLGLVSMEPELPFVVSEVPVDEPVLEPVVPPLVPPAWANAAPAASIEITAKRFHHVFCMRKRSR